jgi:hypothetical protein
LSIGKGNDPREKHRVIRQRAECKGQTVIHPQSEKPDRITLAELGDKIFLYGKILISSGYGDNAALPQTLLVLQYVRKVAVHLGVWVAISRRRTVGPWISLPAPFISALRLSERRSEEGVCE